MNKKRRMKNRETARQLSRDTAPPCPECGQKGPHWVGVPMTLADLMSGTEPEGFWLCDKFYGPDGKRLPANVQIQGAEPLLAKLPWNDGLAGTVPPAPTFETGDDHEQLQRRMRQQRQGEAGV